MSIKIGDFIQGTKNGYEHIKKGVVTDTNVESIKIKVLEHDQGLTFNGWVESSGWVKSSGFKVIGHQKKFSRYEALKLLMNGCKKAILDYDLRGADLSGADLDFSCYPLWCGGLHIKTDKRLACQLAYHLCSMQCDDSEFISIRNSILDFANQFHRVEECGRLLERSNDIGGELDAE